ncbi:hypothetical protein LCGC14_2433320, partial [marine sediment metagenome]
MEKTCSKCGRNKPASEFYRNKGGRDGLRTDCKACVQERKKRMEIVRPPTDTIRTCTKCGQEKLIVEFPFSSIHSTGYRPHCLECKQDAGRKSQITRRKLLSKQPGYGRKENARLKKRFKTVKSMVQHLKESTPCRMCGGKFPYYCLDYHHLDSKSKKFSLHRIRSTSKTRALKEMEKCVVLCSCCHRLAEAEKRGDFHASKNTQKVRNRQIILQAKSVPCVDCGTMFPLPAMDFDHVRGEKLGCVSRLTARFGKTRLLEEMAKCDVVCANCHRIRT